MAERITEKSAIEKQIIKGMLGLKYHHGEYDLKFSLLKSKNPVTFRNGVLSIQSGDALLSHGEAPHYHRHYSILLLSSVWSQVELLHYGRRNIRS